MVDSKRSIHHRRKRRQGRRRHRDRDDGNSTSESDRDESIEVVRRKRGTTWPSLHLASGSEGQQERFAKLCYHMVRRVQSGATDPIRADLTGFYNLKDSDATTFGIVLKHCRRLVAQIDINLDTFDPPDGDGMASVVYFVKRSRILQSLHIRGARTAAASDPSHAMLRVKVVAALVQAAAANSSGRLCNVSLDSVTLPVMALTNLLAPTDSRSGCLERLCLKEITWMARHQPQADVTKLLQSFQTCRLSSLELCGCCPQVLSSILNVNPHLVTLKVTVVERIAKVVRDYLICTTTLNRLDLGQTTMSAPVIQLLLEGLDGNASIQDLSIAECRRMDDSETIWDSLFLWARPQLQSMTVKVMDHDMAKTCCQMLQERTCQLISLKITRIRGDLAKLLLPGLTKNRTLTTLQIHIDSPSFSLASLPRVHDRDDDASDCDNCDDDEGDWHTTLPRMILSRSPFLQSFESNRFGAEQQLFTLRNRCLRLFHECGGKGGGFPGGLWAHVLSKCQTAWDAPQFYEQRHLGLALVLFLWQSAPDSIVELSLYLVSSAEEECHGSSRHSRHRPRRLCAV